MSRVQSIKDRVRDMDTGGRTDFLNLAKLEELKIPKYKMVESNWVAFIPLADEGYFGLPIEVHYRIGVAGDKFLCPMRMWRDPCPICEERASLYENGDPDKAVVKPLFPTSRCLFLIVDYNNDSTIDEGLKLLDAPYGVEQEMLKQSKDQRSGEVIDLSEKAEGYRTLFFACENPGKPHAKYSGYKLEKRDALKPEWLAQAFDLSTILIVPTYSDILQSFKIGSEPSGSKSSGTETKEPEPETTGNELADHVIQDIEEHGRSKEQQAKDEPEPEGDSNPESEKEVSPEPKEESKEGSKLESLKARIANKMKNNK